MNFDVKDRKQQLDTFSTFINESYQRIDDMLQSIGWTREYLTNENTEMVSCPLNPEHRVPEKSLDSHVELCSWRREGYHEQDTPLPENPIENFENTKSSIVIDAQLQGVIIKEAKEQDSSLLTGNLEDDKRLVPKTSDRLTADFTPDERRILYDYVISKTKPVEDVKVEELQFIGDMKRDEHPRPKSKLELLIEQRDAKRRRISYKKKVHTNRKTHTEVLREVIHNQMDLLEQIIKGECDDEIRDGGGDEDVDDDRDEIFSLGGDEVNILSTRSKIENKSSHGIGRADAISGKERNFVRKVPEKEIEQHGNYQSEDSSVASENVEKRSSRSEQSSENWSGKSENYVKYEKHSYERKRWGERHGSSSSSLGEKASKDRYHINDNRGAERSRDYWSYDREKNRHHQSRMNSEEFEEHRQYSRKSSKHDRSEFKKQYYSHSKHDKYSSKRDASEVDREYEKESDSQTKRYKYSSKYSSPDHDRKHEINPHRNYTGTHKGDDASDKYSDRNNVHSKEFRREDNYDGCRNGRDFDWSSEHQEIKFKAAKDEMSPESRKYAKKVKKNKKKKKSHKHRSKKKYKKKKSNSSCSSSSSQSSTDGSNSDSS